MEMVVQAVVVLDHAGGATLGGHGVTAHRIDLGDQSKRERGVGFGHRDGGAQASAAGPHNGNIDFNNIHEARSRNGFAAPHILRNVKVDHGAANKGLI